MIKLNFISKIILATLCLGYVLMSYGKFHTSSIAAWDYFLGKDYRKSVILGKPQLIRQDEWMINTPNSVNLYDKTQRNTFDYFKLLINPKGWPHLLLKENDHERRFAFNWNMKVFGFLISTYLLFLLLTGNNILLSVTGTLILLLSSSFQWWSYHLGMHMTSFNILTLGFLYFVYTTEKWKVFLSAWLILVGLYSIFTDGLYPAWQVPLAYLYLSVVVGFFWQNPFNLKLDKNIKVKGLVVMTGILVIAYLGYDFYQGIVNTASLLLNTEYPGKRFSTGGDVKLSSLFNEYALLLYSEENIPKSWSNICEASGVIFVLPVIVYGIIRDFIKKQNISFIVFPLFCLNILFLWWVLIGFFPFLSKISLMSFSPGYRTLPVLGISNIFLLITYLSHKKDKQTFDLKEIIFFLGAFIFYFILVFNSIQSGSQGFFKSFDLSISLLFVFFVFLTIYFYNYKKVYLLFSLITLLFLAKNITVHPLMKGLKPLVRNEITKTALEIKKADPTARWAVFGSARISALLVPAGIDKINGVQPVPNFKDLYILDPSKKYEKIYNRYAHIAMRYAPSIQNKIIFQLPEDKSILDYYTIIVHPCNEKLKQLQVKYILFTYKPTEEETRCLTLLHDLTNQFIYKIN
jgi:hypothetical protein